MSAQGEEARLLTLKQVADELGVPLHRVRLAVAHLGDRVTRQIAGREGGRGTRKHLYGPEAVAAIRRRLDKDQARKQSALHDAAAWWQRLARLRLGALQLGRLAAEAKAVYEETRRHPPKVSTTVSTLPDPRLTLVHPIPVLLCLLRSAWQASWPEARIEARAVTAAAALSKLREEVARTWLALENAPETDPESFQVLAAVIRSAPRKREP